MFAAGVTGDDGREVERSVREDELVHEGPHGEPSPHRHDLLLCVLAVHALRVPLERHGFARHTAAHGLPDVQHVPCVGPGEVVCEPGA